MKATVEGWVTGSPTSSSIAAMVTRCGMSQFAGVKVSTSAETKVWASGPIVMVTFSVGCESSTTVNVSVIVPSTTIVVPPDWVMVTPATGPAAGAEVTTMSSTPTHSSLPTAFAVMMRTCTCA